MTIDVRTRWQQAAAPAARYCSIRILPSRISLS
jgi:hypothetical protein